MNKFHQFQKDIFSKHVAEIVLPLPDGVMFSTGAVIHKALPVPLIFETGYSMQEPPTAILSNRIPVLSDALIKALQEAGVSNLQCFPAEVSSSVDGTVWKNYQAVNVIGLIACADLEKSKYIIIADRCGEGAVPLMGFKKLKVDPVRARDQLFFRLAEEPSTIIVSGRVVEYLRTLKSTREWGLTLDEKS